MAPRAPHRAMLAYSFRPTQKGNCTLSTRFIAVLFFGCVAVGAAEAQDCDPKQSLNQSEMNACAYQAQKTSDDALNALYDRIMKRLKYDADTKELLKTSQRLWVEFRDADCRFQTAANVGGSAYSMIYSLCLRSLTDTRVSELKVYLNCDEGDLGCPVPGK